MAVMGTSLTLHGLPPLQLLLLLLLLPFVADSAVTLNITNRCSYTVWPAAFPANGGMQLDRGGMQLDPGKTWTLNVPENIDARLWARTGCSFDGKGIGTCQTGDCQGMLSCTSNGQPPFTLAELFQNTSSFDTSVQNKTSFDISLYNGFNIPMEFLPMPVKGQGGAGCSKGPRCAANITSQCPSELKAPGGCIGECALSIPNTCAPTKHTAFFVQMCPDAVSNSSDVLSSTTFICPRGTDYQIVFCPPTDLTSSPGSMGSSSNKGLTISLILGSVVSFILIATLIFYIVHRQRTRRRQAMEEEEAEFGKLHGMPIRFTFQQLEVATEQFRDKLGEGGFGSVFKGQFGEERIAVKRLDPVGQGEREFSAEVQTIGSIHHINLVRLIGFCAEKSHRLLVYEYMPKGSLDRWIYCRHDNNSTPLDWSTRYKIITHIAKGLSYLHEECTRRIAHLDVKPQNILLDDNFNAKLSDFGLCKLIDRDMSQVVTRMRGTPGYLAPEWLTSQITEKADVYSFGVVVMEIISGRKNLDTSRSEESIHLITLLEEKVKSDQLVDLIDNNINDMQSHKQDVIQMMKLAMWCLQIDCKKRPNMSEVVKVLEGTMNADINIDHKFVATSPANFGITGNVSSSAPPLASEVSGPR